jgi:hypothetical protein
MNADTHATSNTAERLQPVSAHEADASAATWQDYGNTLIPDGYRAWASIRHAQYLMQVVMYAGDADTAFGKREPVVWQTAIEMTTHADRYVRLQGYTLFVDLVARHPEILEYAIHGLVDELMQAVEAGRKTN